MKTYWSGFLFVVLAGVVAMTGLTGCTTGFRVSFGVSPVTAINENQTLTQQEAEHGK